MEEKQIRIKSTQFGPCGIYCGACGAEDCNGCKSDLIDDTIRNCKFRKCAVEKEIEFCCFCNEYPCKDLKVFMTDQYPHHWTIKTNLESIRVNGKEKWLSAQQAEWSCDQCTKRIFWYQKQCSCGIDLDAFEFPQKS